MKEDLPNEAASNHLDENRHRFLDAVDAITDCFVIWDKDLKFVVCNKSFRELHHAVDHLLVPGVKFEDYIRARAFSDRQAHIIRNEEDWIAERINFMRTGTSNYEFQIDDNWYRVNRKKLDNGDYVNIQKNITVEKTRELALFESEKLYRTLFEFCPDAVFIHDGKTIFGADPDN